MTSATSGVCSAAHLLASACHPACSCSLKISGENQTLQEHGLPRTLDGQACLDKDNAQHLQTTLIPGGKPSLRDNNSTTSRHPGPDITAS